MMYGAHCKRLIQNRNLKIWGGYSNTHLGIVQCSHVTSLSFIIKSFSSSILPNKEFKAQDEKEHSFTVSYLVNSCGLSLENAISVSEKVHFQNPENPNSVLTLLKNHGFTNAHISKFVMKRPSLLLANAKNNLSPKLEFLHSIGVPSSDIGHIMSIDPYLFMYSLENRIIPCYHFLKSLVGTNENVVKALRCSSIIFRENWNTNFAPNMEILREHGVPQSSILFLITRHPEAAFFKHVRFKEVVDYLKGMGFDPKKSMFVKAINGTCAIGEAALEERFKIYSRWGWSKDDAISAFKCQPDCMLLSEKRIVLGMDFLVDKMGFASKAIARRPVILCFSLEKRLIPRCLVFKALLSKGLVKNNLSMHTLLQPSEKYFLQRFVTRFQENFPELMDLYDGKMDLVNLGIELEEKCEMTHS